MEDSRNIEESSAPAAASSISPNVVSIVIPEEQQEQAPMPAREGNLLTGTSITGVRLSSTVGGDDNEKQLNCSRRLDAEISSNEILQTGPAVVEEHQEGEAHDHDDNDDDEKFQKKLVGAERLIAFTDAVVAIAMTLLILPLMDAATEFETIIASEDGQNGTEVTTESMSLARQFFSDNSYKMVAFLISFFVISTLWRSHDRVFRHVSHVTPFVRKLNVFWMCGIVFVPVVSSLVSSHPDTSISATYIGVIIYIFVLQFIMMLLVRNEPRMWKVQQDESTSSRKGKDKTNGEVNTQQSEEVVLIPLIQVIDSLLDITLSIIALIISITVPNAQTLSLLVLIPAPWIARLIAYLKPNLTEQ